VTNTIPLGVERWRPAWMFAAQIHSAQTVPDSRANYLAHLGNVMMEIISAHLAVPLDDLDLAMQCAALHDTIEDQGVTQIELSERFGEAVADGVLALTKSKKVPKTERMRDSLARIKLQPMAVWCVKLADRISNLQSVPSHWPGPKIASYRTESEMILEALRPAHRILASRLEAFIASYPTPRPLSNHGSDSAGGVA
jgi:(p)ppGpp synthase/HD superfamily hydrolase